MKHLKKFSQIFEEGEPAPSGKVGNLVKDFISAFDFAGKNKKSEGGKTFADIYNSGEGIYSDPTRYSSGSSTISEPIQKQMDLVRNYLEKYGIKNKLVQDAILSTIGKESGFRHTEEMPYTNTSAKRIRDTFGGRNGIKNMTDQQINDIKKDKIAFWELVYGGEWGRKNLGNTQAGDGYKYVGRGYNGITGRSNYENLARIMRSKGSKFDIAKDPTLLSKNIEAMAEANAAYFYNALNNRLLRSKYKYSDPNDIKNFDTALMAVLNANAGAGNNMTGMIAKEGIRNSKNFAAKYGLGKDNDEISRTA